MMRSWIILLIALGFTSLGAAQVPPQNTNPATCPYGLTCTTNPNPNRQNINPNLQNTNPNMPNTNPGVYPNPDVYTPGTQGNYPNTQPAVPNTNPAIQQTPSAQNPLNAQQGYNNPGMYNPSPGNLPYGQPGNLNNELNNGFNYPQNEGIYDNGIYSQPGNPGLNQPGTGSLGTQPGNPY